MTGRTRQIHRAFAVIIAAFVILHLGGHLFAWGGIAQHTRALEWARIAYRHPFAESLLIAAAFGQVAIGLKLAITRWRHSGDAHSTDQHWGRLQLASGLALAIFLTAHVSAALSARWLAGIDTNFYWPAGTLTLAPIKLVFWPYYLIAVFALFAHIGCALHFAGRAGLAKIMVTLGMVMAPIIVLPFSGLIYPVELPAEHLEYFANHLGAKP